MDSRTRPSYAQGLATPERGGLVYPSLWDGVVGAWLPSAGATGLTLRDHSGKRNDGTLTSFAPLSSGWADPRGISLDGTNDHVSCGTSLDLGPEFTASARFRSTGDGVIIAKLPDTVVWWYFNIASGRLNFQFDDDSTKVTLNPTTTGYDDGSWYHVVVTRNANGYTLYSDGKAVATAANNGSLVNSGDFRIGEPQALGNVITGTIDDVAIWNRALSSNEISTLHRLGPGGMYRRKRRVIISNPVTVTPPTAASGGMAELYKRSRPSFSGGYASPLTGGLAFPELWHKCEAAWSASLGPTWLVLKEMTGRTPDASLLNIQTANRFVIDGGGYSIYAENDSGNEYATTGYSPTGLTAWTVTSWVKFESNPNTTYVWGAADNPFAGRWYLRRDSDQTTMRIGCGASTFTYATTAVNDVWTCYSATYDGAAVTLYVDGVEVGSDAISGQSFSTEAVYIGALNFGGTATDYGDQYFDDIHVYSEAKPASWQRLVHKVGRSGSYARKRRVIISNPVTVTPPTAASGGMVELYKRSRPSYSGGYASAETGGLVHKDLWNGVVGSWAPSLGATGLTLRDHSGLGNDGTVTGATEAEFWADVPRGATFDGTDDYVLCSDPKLTGSFSVGCWFVSNDTSTFTLASSRTGSIGVSQGFDLYRDATNTAVQLDTYNNGRKLALNSIIPTSGQRYFIVATYDDSTQDAVIYIDGVENASGTASAAISHSAELEWGKWNGGSAFYLNGTIDAPTLWNRVLSPNEISELHRLGPGGMYRRKRRVIISNPVTVTPPTAASGGMAELYKRSRPSFSGGMATHNQSAYPSLWDGVVGAWLPSAGATGSQLRDFSGRNNHGTLVDSTLSTAWQPDGLLQDGTDDYVNVPDNDSLNFQYSDSFSILMWIKSTNAVTNTELLEKQGSPGLYEIRWSGSALRMRVRGDDNVPSGTLSVTTVTTGIDDGEWHLMIGTRDRSQGKLFMYLDGKFEASVTDTTTDGVFNSGDLKIGTGNTLLFFDGTISQVTMYNRALPANEIAQLHRLGPGGMYRRKRRVLASNPVNEAPVAGTLFTRTLLGVGA